MQRIKKIIHIDMDCFFAAIEMRDDPSLASVPLAIGGGADQRGVVCTANYVARQFGIKSAMSTAHALKLCPSLTLISPRHSYYKMISQEIQAIFKRYTELVEPISLDEAYLDVSNSAIHNGSATLIAKEIRDKIYKETKLTASAGVAPLMFLAKIASDINKPNGMYVIPPEKVHEFISSLDLKKIPGVGKVTAQKLAGYNLNTCADIQQCDHHFLLKTFGKFGQTLWDHAHGKELREVDAKRIRKSISVERTFNQDIDTWAELLKAFEQLYSELKIRCDKYKKNNEICKIQVKMKFNDFKQTTLETGAKQLDSEPLQILLKKIWIERREARQIRTLGIGVILKKTTEVTASQQLELIFDQ